MGEVEDEVMAFALAFGSGQTGGAIAVDDVLGVGFAFADGNFSVAMRRVFKVDFLAVGGGVEFAEEEVAAAAFVEADAGAVGGKLGMGKDLEAEGGDVLAFEFGEGEGEGIDVAFGVISAGEDGAVFTDLEAREIGGGGARGDGGQGTARAICFLSQAR